jgi:hypothetical protein
MAISSLSWLKPRMFGKAKYGAATGSLEAQLWTFEPDLPEDEAIFQWPGRDKPICHLAVMAADATYLIQSKSCA